MPKIIDNVAIKIAKIGGRIRVTKQVQYVLSLTGCQTKNSTTMLKMNKRNTNFNVTQVEIDIRLRVTTET